MLKNIIILFAITVVSLSSCSQSLNCNLDSSRRTRITSMDVSNSYSCYMEMKRGWHTYDGSGALIHPRVIITAGHNLAYFPIVRNIPFLMFRGTRKIDLYFGSIDSTHFISSSTIKLKKGKSKFFKSWYWIYPTIKRDYSIIILPDSSIYKKVGGCYKLKPIKNVNSITSQIHITGSPGDKNNFEMWTDSTANFRVENASLRYDLFTAPRNSGSPIWTRTKDGLQLVGVHSRGFGSCNASVLIDEEVYNEVVKWCKTVGITLDK